MCVIAKLEITGYGIFHACHVETERFGKDTFSCTHGEGGGGAGTVAL